MKRQSLIKSFLSVLTIGTFMLFTTSCSDNHGSRVEKTPEVNITTTVGPSDGLDLKLVGQLFQEGTVKDAEGLEKTLNKEGGINNLDLDANGSVDYINVSENKSDGASKAKSFDLTTGQDSTMTHIATIEIEKGANDEYTINMAGSENVYGSGHNYNTNFHSTGDMLFYAWLFSPRPHYYHSPYHYGHYPFYYGGSRVVVSNTTYVNRTVTQRTTANKSFTKTKTSSVKSKSQNKGKASKSTRTSINNHKTKVKKMETRKKAAVKAKATKARATKAKAAKASRARASRASSSRSSSYGSSSSSRSSSRSSGGRRSDIKYKMNITNFDNGLETIMKLNGVYYDWKPIDNFESVVGGKFDGSRQVGFIAQDVEKVIPEIVFNDKHGKNVEYYKVIPILVEAIKTLEIKLDSVLTSKI
jgi:hypothetical protein